MVDEETVQVVTERHRGVESITDGLLCALVHWQGLEAVGVDAGPRPQVLVLNELLLDPAESELCITVVIWEPVPAHHVQDVEDAVALAVDAVQDRVLVLASALVSVSARKIAGKALHLLSTFAVNFCRSIRSDNKVSPTLNSYNIKILHSPISSSTSGQRMRSHLSTISTGTSTSHSDNIN